MIKAGGKAGTELFVEAGTSSENHQGRGESVQPRSLKSSKPTKSYYFFQHQS